MQQEKDYHLLPLFEPMPIAALEAKVEKIAGKQVMTITQMKLSDLNGAVTSPDLPLYVHVTPHEYEKILQAVHNELNTLLLKLVGSEVLQISPQDASQETKLKLMIFEEGRNRGLREEIHHIQPENDYPHAFVFGLSLVNEVETIVPRGIYITVSFHWDGIGPTLSPNFDLSPAHEGWTGDWLTNLT
jgi:hypothetical protein